MAEIAEKHPFEQDAEESADDSFIDDDDEDESDSDAAEMVRSETRLLRNRSAWVAETETCPTCRCDELTNTVYCIERQARGWPHHHIVCALQCEMQIDCDICI